MLPIINISDLRLTHNLRPGLIAAEDANEQGSELESSFVEIWRQKNQLLGKNFVAGDFWRSDPSHPRKSAVIN